MPFLNVSIQGRMRNTAWGLLLLTLGGCSSQGGAARNTTDQPSPSAAEGTGNDPVNPAATYTVGGTLSGLLPGRTVTLQLNGGETLELASNGPFTFSSALGNAAAYSISILTPPAQPALNCMLSSHTGTIAAADVTQVSVVCPSLVALQLESAHTTLPPNGGTQTTLFATFSDATTRDVSSWTTFGSSDTGVLTLSASGAVTAVGAGTALAQGTFESMTATRSIVVSAATLSTISVTPANPSLALASQVQFVATGTYSDGSHYPITSLVTWSSSQSSNLAIGSTTGLGSGSAAGTATITATLGAVSGSTQATVTSATLTGLQVSPVLFTGATGSTKSLTATALYSNQTSSDVTTQVSWSSSNPAVATVNTGGHVALLGAGSATITATLGGQSSNAQFTVTGATLTSITLSPGSLNLPTSLTRTFSATGTYSDASTQDLSAQVSWSFSDTGVAIVSNAAGNPGKLTSVAVGTGTISAAFAGVTGTATVNVTAATLASINITPGSMLLPRGANLQFSATGIFSDASSHPLTEFASWSNSNATVGVISNAAGSRGALTNQYVGTAYPATNVRATFLGVQSPISRITVTPATLSSVSIQPATVQLNTLRTQALQAFAWFSDGAAVEITDAGTWISDVPAQVFASNAHGTRGQVTTLQEGNTPVRSYFGGQSGARSIEVSNLGPESVVTNGIGLTATYHNNMTLSSLVGSRIEPQINYNWAAGLAPLGVGDSFSVRWTGEVLAPVSGTYTFFTQSDDGVRLWVNGTSLVNNWTNHASTENSGSIALTAGTRYPIVLEFYENGGFAVMELRWQAPGIPKALIPSQYFFP